MTQAVQGISETDPIEFEAEPISSERMAKLREVTYAQSDGVFPPTFPTIFRKGEFAWLDQQEMKLKNLLHTEQEYEYLRPLEPGKTPKVVTRLKTKRARRGLIFFTLESEISIDGEVAVRSRSMFVVRQGDET